MIPGRPSHLQNYNAFGARIGSNHFRSHAHHPKGASQKRAFAGKIVANLPDEVIAGNQIEAESLPVEDGSLLRLQSAVGVKSRHISAPSDVGRPESGAGVDGLNVHRPDQLAKALLAGNKTGKKCQADGENGGT